MVTAETAVTIPVVLAVFTMMVSALSVVLAQGTACHAARVVAREVALGKTPSQSIEVASQTLSNTGIVDVARNGDWAKVTVSNQSATLFGFQASCEVVTRVEPQLP